MNTHETYVSLEVAKLLKQAGFDWECNHHFCLEIFSENEVPYRNHNSGVDAYGHDNRGQYMSAPTLSVAQKWLREVKGIDIIVHTEDHYGTHYSKAYYCSFYIGYTLHMTSYSEIYESALEAGIKKCLTLILEKDDK